MLRIELVGQSVNETLGVELQEVAGYGWFPRKASMKKMRDDTLEKSSDTTIAVKSINEGVDDQVFTLLGMGAPLGTRVYDHRHDEVTEMRLTEDGRRKLHTLEQIIRKLRESHTDDRGGGIGAQRPAGPGRAFSGLTKGHNG